MTQHNNGISFTVNGKTLYFSEKEVFNWNINGWLVSHSLYPVKYKIEKIDDPYDYFDCDKLPTNYSHLENDSEAWELAKKEGFILDNGGNILDWKPKNIIPTNTLKEGDVIGFVKFGGKYEPKIFLEEEKTFCANYERDNIELIGEKFTSENGLHSAQAAIIDFSDKKDSIVESVRTKLLERSKVGVKKYGTTLDKETLLTSEWIEHAIQEALDFSLYLTKLKEDIILWEQNKKI